MSFTELERVRLGQALSLAGSGMFGTPEESRAIPLSRPAHGARNERSPKLMRLRGTFPTLPSFSTDCLLVALAGHRWICTSTEPPSVEPATAELPMGRIPALCCPPLDGSWSSCGEGLEAEQERGFFRPVDLRAPLHPWLRGLTPAEREFALPGLEMLVYQPRMGSGFMPLGEAHRSIGTVARHAREDLERPVSIDFHGYDERRVSHLERVPDPEERARATGTFLFQTVPHETQHDGKTERLLWVELEVSLTDWQLSRRLLWEVSLDGLELS